jgi:hypothetical protein
VAGTIAHLTDDVTVKNTFTVGNVSITMVESLVDEYGNVTSGTTNQGNSYKLIPGHSYTKDPTIKVSENSEDCYIFVMIENGLGSDATLPMNDGWAEVSKDGNTYIWVYGTTEDPKAVSANDNAVVPFSTFTFGQDADPESYKDSSINVTAYAIQTDTLNSKTAAELWALLNPLS